DGGGQPGVEAFATEFAEKDLAQAVPRCVVEATVPRVLDVHVLRLLANEHVDAADDASLDPLLGPLLEILLALVALQVLNLLDVVGRDAGIGFDEQVAGGLAVQFADLFVGLLDGLGTEELAVVLDLRGDGGRPRGGGQPGQGEQGQGQPAAWTQHDALLRRGACADGDRPGAVTVSIMATAGGGGWGYLGAAPTGLRWGFGRARLARLPGAIRAGGCVRFRPPIDPAVERVAGHHAEVVKLQFHAVENLLADQFV